eukprot:2594560-Rhodomonas_salina.1
MPMIKTRSLTVSIRCPLSIFLPELEFVNTFDFDLLVTHQVGRQVAAEPACQHQAAAVYSQPRAMRETGLKAESAKV